MKAKSIIIAMMLQALLCAAFSQTAVENAKKIAEAFSKAKQVAKPEFIIRYIEDEDLFGLVNKSTYEVDFYFPPEYEDIRDFSDGMACFREDGLFGFVDDLCVEIIPARYTKATDFKDGLAAVQLDGKWGIINHAGKEITRMKYDAIREFSEGLAVVTLGNKQGFINRSGVEVLPPTYAFLSNMEDGWSTFLVERDGLLGIVNGAGKVIVPPRYQYLSDGFFDDMMMVQVKGKFGFINRSAKEVIPPVYDDARLFSEGKAEVELNGKRFYISKSGKKVE